MNSRDWDELPDIDSEPVQPSAADMLLKVAVMEALCDVEFAQLEREMAAAVAMDRLVAQQNPLIFSELKEIKQEVSHQPESKKDNLKNTKRKSLPLENPATQYDLRKKEDLKRSKKYDGFFVAKEKIQPESIAAHTRSSRRRSL